MAIFYIFLKLGANIIYFFMKIRRTCKKKVVFISRLDEKKTLDFTLIEKYLLKTDPEIQCIFICHRVENFKKGLFKNFIFTLDSLRELASAKVCVTDSFSIAVCSVKHKKKLKIIQIWHSLTAVKKFGLQSVGKPCGRGRMVSKILNMHRNYDYIICGSDYSSKFFAEAFGYKKDRILPFGLPRIDYLIKNQESIKNNIFRRYHNLKEKPNILYVPTFRDSLSDNWKELIDNVDLSKFNLIIKSHPRQKLTGVDESFIYNDIPALDLLTICEYVITDYSGIAVEAASINKKVLYYVYDYEDYIKKNGVNVDLYKEMVGCVFDSGRRLCEFIEQGTYNENALNTLKNRYIDVQDGTSTEKICRLIMSCLQE